MPVSLWLRPAAPDAEALDKAIADYALPRDRTPFLAHLTLAAGDVDLSDQDFAKLAAEASSIILEPNKTLQTSAFYQAFALRFHQSSELMALREKAFGLLSKTAGSDYTPHLSLTYGTPVESANLPDIVAQFDRPVRFDRLILVRHDTYETSQAAVAAWRLSDPLPLGT